MLSLGIISGYSLVAYAHAIPGITEPYDPPAYYSLTEISWRDSPSPFALMDMARNFGMVYDYTRHIKSILFGEKFEKTAETAENKSENEEKNTKSDIGAIKDNLKIAYQKTGLVKYDAFREMSGALSYSLALLDQENNGVLISSMYSREGCYSYAKDIVKGESKINLSEEEAEALKQAVAK